MLDLRRLRLLHALSRYQTIAATAQALHLTGPAISQQLAALEKEAGAQLLARNGRRLYFTEAGAVLLAHAEIMLDQMATAEAALASLGDEITGTVRVGIFPSAAVALLPTVWASVRANHGERLRLQVTELDPGDSLRALTRGTVELAVAHSYDLLPRTLPPNCVAEQLLTDPVLVAVPQTHAAGPIDLLDLAELDWITTTAGSSCHEMIQRACGVAGFVPNITASFSDYPAILAMVGAGAGVTLLPRLAAEHLPDGVSVRVLRNPVNRNIFAAMRANGYHAPAVRVVLDEFKAASAVRDQYP
ncbi:LysR family transcriptional regulator [Hamadaea tsunoensis]|uniref:LysR family transcriptional regulator n=1 Tax=Hamadaea tsunoensis TaxID=53368 RepID=UPI0004061C88|nr:LysR family transcriptional regulator [Hamadaea tsunoensis]